MEQINQNFIPGGFMGNGKCRRCGRVLKSLDAIAKGIGPTCAKKVGFVVSVQPADVEQEIINDPDDGAVILIREGNIKKTNVPHVWVWHSPTGFEWGYGGSGPADLALNILLKFGATRDEAARFHQDFKWKFIGGIPKEGGRIPAERIQQFLSAARVECA